MKILIAEDEEISRIVLRITLEEWGHDVVAACDGQEAWAVMQGIDAPQLAVLDWMMPEIEGPALCRALRKQERTDPLYLILLTSKTDGKDVFQGLQAGADDYIIKPYDSRELQARLNVGRRIIALQNELRGRVKELTAVYNLSRLIREKEDLTQILQGTVDLIPESWQYPDITCARLMVEGRSYTTQNYEDTAWRLSRDLVVAARRIGTLDVGYVEQRPQADEGPFLKEEGHLITVIAERLQSVIEREKAEENREKLQAQLRQALKMEAIGTLSGGIAHDFNNLLSIILGSLSLVRDDIERGSESSEYLQEAENAIFRAKDLTTRLITFSKGGDPVRKVMSIGRFVKESVPLALGGSATDCEISVPDDLSPVEFDEDQIKQVINNIVINAQEAMDGKGVVRVQCENIAIADSDPLQIEEGKYVKISIKDQGVGIAEENIGKIFDPYFSTKERGIEKGMGLGLSVCHSIVEKHNGLITVESDPGTGTTFTLYLPASDKVITEPKPPEEDLLKEPISGSGKLLLMDDEEMIRKLAINRLSRLGYDVEVAKDGDESIELYRNAKDSGTPFDVVILDLTIRMGMGGKEAIQKLHEINPDVKGIVSTGYSNDPVVTNCREYGFKGALAKPYTTEELSKVLYEVISEE